MSRLLSPGLLFPALAIALFPKAFVGLGAFFHYDTWMQNFTFRAWWFEQLRSGTFATWCPGMFGGFPLFAETQTGALYPLTFPLFLALPATLAFSWSVILHFALAGVGAWRLAGRLGAGTAGAVLAGVGWELSGFLVTHVVHFNLLIGAALAPWALYFAWGMWGGSVRAAVGLTVTIACLLLGSHPYATLMTLLLVAIALVFRAGLGAAFVGRGGLLALVVVAATALAAVQVLPTREFLAYTPRGEAVDYSFLTFGSFPPWHAATLVAPDLFGTPVNGSFWAGPDWSHFAETCAYAGLLTLALAVAALVLRRDLATGLLGSVAALSFLLMLGKYTPLYRILTWIPLWQSTRLPGRFALLFGLALALLAGLGLDALLREKSGRRRRVAAVVGAVVVTLLAIYAAALAPATSEAGLDRGLAWPAKLSLIAANAGSVSARLWVGLAASLAALAPFALRRAPGTAAAIAAIVVVGVDLFTWGVRFNPLVPPAFVTEPPPIVAALPDTAPRPRVFRQGADEMWERAPGLPRTDMFTPAWSGNETTYASGAWALPPNSQLLYGVDSGEGFTSLIPSQWLEWMGLATRPGAAPRPDLTDAQADLLALDAVISTGSGIAGPGWEPSALPGDVWISRNADPMPRVRLARSWEVLSREEVLARIRAEDHDPRTGVLLERGKAGTRTRRDAGAVDEALPAREVRAGEWEIEVPSGTEGIIVVAESWDPGWIAVDAAGEERPVLRADGLFVSFFAPSDGGTVTLRHAPPELRTGGIVSVIVLIVVVALAAMSRKWKLPPLGLGAARDGVGRMRNLAPVAFAVALVAVSRVTDSGAWSHDQRDSTLGAAAARSWTNEAFAAYNGGALDDAANLLEAARELVPYDVNVHYRLGVVERARGRYNDARVAFERALEIDPSMAPARDALRALRESLESRQE